MFLYFVSNDSEKGGKKTHDTSDMMRISHMVYDAYR